ncbi:AraC family transcriptional regulator [Paraburkholderia sp. DHOC27]|uniref:AraC family transcriptional regulator n=1 Tax=Paraburkholderia sp. DHOC27 TaxID=2303330 RepID=UPI000E3D0ED2|nr:AraC family transcriptional regulator [Paraburkholderia sp. DHOC27]RFU44058.1 AraC family transcriptional regulator [Paraburkholderia sp. DHOC27]
MADYLTQLRADLLRHAHGRRTETPIPRVALSRGHATTGPLSGLYEPMLCQVVQGAKSVLIGDRVLNYDPGNCFVTAVEVPATGRIVEASEDSPYLAISLVFDPDVIAELLPHLPGTVDEPVASFAVAPVSADLLEAWTRMTRLLDRVEDIPVLAPMIEREILYRLMQGPQAGVLRQIARIGSRLAQIRQAVAQIREQYDRVLRIEDMAETAGMSLSTFHRHFKAVTAMTPLQYQKTVRLQHARRILMVEDRAVTQVAYEVGYESPSQFSREYARQFGAPPAHDAVRLRAAPALFDEA